MSFTLPLPYEMINEIYEYRGISVNRENFNTVMYEFKEYADERHPAMPLVRFIAQREWSMTEYSWDDDSE